MSRKSWLRHVEWAATLGIVFAAGAWAQAQDRDRPEPRASAGVRVPAPRWIGVFCRPVDEALRAQLKLPQGEGLIIDQVAPDSPAATAGLNRHDVLLSANGKPLATPEDLIRAIDAAAAKEEGQAVEFELLRGGQREKLSLEPGERPAGDPDDVLFHERDLDALRMWVERLGRDGGGPLHLRGFGPGMIMGHGPANVELPDDVSIQITRQGKEPAEIVVKRGEDEWKVSEKELDKLPKELQPLVHGLLGKGPIGIHLGAQPFNIPLPGPGMPPGARVLVRGPEGALGERLEQRFREMDERLEKLMDEVRKLREEQ